MSKTADPLAPNLRLYHPEDGIVVQQLLHPGIEAGFDFHVGEIVGQRRALHHPNVYAAALDAGFSPSIPSALVVISVTSGP